MTSPAFRRNVVRVLFIFALITFLSGVSRFFGIYRSPTLAQIHHYSGLCLVVCATAHMILNRKALLLAWRSRP